MRRTASILAAAVSLLLVFGLVLLFSASAVRGGSPVYFLERQLSWLAIGLVAGWLAWRVDYRFWRRGLPLALVAVFMVAGLLAVFAFGKVNGSHRWIRLGGVNLQPGEFAKVGLVVLLAAWFDRVGPRARTFWRGAVWPGLVLGAVVALLVCEPDYGAALVAGVVGGTILLAAGTRLIYLFAGGGGAAAALLLLLWCDPVRRPRLDYYLGQIAGCRRHEAAAGAGAAAGEHVRQSINAFIAGGPWGAGLNNSIQKYHYLPEAHTDFIFAIAGEEFGLPGTLAVVALFAVVLVCGMAIARHAEDRFGRLLALGLTVLLIFAAGFNIGVVTGCLPTKGLALPFISYGGSSLVASLIAVGLLVNVAQRIGAEESRPMRNALRHV